MEFTGLAAEMAELAGGYGSVDPHAADRDALEWALGTGRRLRGMLDARDAQITCRLEALIRQALPASGSSEDRPTAGADADDAADATDAGENAGSSAAGSAGAGSAGGGHRETAEEYRLRLRRAKWLKRLPSFNAALEAGAITTAHVDAVAAVLDHVEPTVVAEVLADEEALLEVARTVTRASFARYLQRRVDRVRADGGTARLQRQIKESFGSLTQDDDTEMYRLFVRLDPIRGERVFTAVRQRVEQLQQSGAAEGMRRGQVIAQAVTDLICGAAEAGSGGVNVLVVADLRTLLQGPHDGSICETGDGASVPVDVVRDLCRQASTTITVAVRDADGVTVAVGERPPPPDGPRGSSPPGDRDAARSTADIAAMIAEALEAATGDSLRTGRDLRLANRAQRRALRAMYRTCAHPGCRVPFADCFIHHVTPWDDGGLTDLDNLLPLCGHHHHLIHDTGWRRTIDARRTLRWYEPGGRLDTEQRFQALGATTGLGDGATPATERDPAVAPSTSVGGEPAIRPGDPATDPRWTRSRSARGAPPTTEHEALRLFDPPAA
jgi:hypothetical protein